jgi:uncharacterized membrane protein
MAMDSWHPVVVHFPIVLLPLSAGLDLLAFLRRRPKWHSLAYGILLLGSLAALLAVWTGNDAAAPYRRDAAVQQHLARHEDLATVALFLFLGIALGRLPLHLRGRLQGWPLRGWVLAALLGSALLGVVAHYGGELVYRYAVGVRASG